MPAKSQSLTLLAKAECLGPAAEFVKRGAREANLTEEHTQQLELLLEEVLANIWRYSYPEDAPGPVTVTYSVPGTGELDVEIGDQGVEFDPLSAAPPDLTLGLADRPVGGLGIFLVKSFASRLRYRREQGWNRLMFGISAK